MQPALTLSRTHGSLGKVEQQMENSIEPFIDHMSLLSVGQQTKFAANI